MGRRDVYKRGDWNTVCYVCGFKRKASEMKLRWDGVYCCKQDWEIRQPQDFVRGVPDEQAPPWTQPEPPNVFNGAVAAPITNVVVGTPTIFVNSTPQVLGTNYTISLPVGVVTFITQYPSGSMIAWSGVWLDNAGSKTVYTMQPIYLWAPNTSVYQLYGT
jgi:hypothetical protein